MNTAYFYRAVYVGDQLRFERVTTRITQRKQGRVQRLPYIAQARRMAWMNGFYPSQAEALRQLQAQKPMRLTGMARALRATVRGMV